MVTIKNTMMRPGLVYTNAVGPWPCERCGKITQFAEMKGDKNHIFCKNDYCRFERIVNMKDREIVEADGSVWKYDPYTSEKVQIRRR